jgi:hypothetical protein
MTVSGVMPSVAGGITKHQIGSRNTESSDVNSSRFAPVIAHRAAALVGRRCPGVRSLVGNGLNDPFPNRRLAFPVSPRALSFRVR